MKKLTVDQQKLVIDNLGFAYFMARRYRRRIGPRVSADDLFAACTYGLVHAATTFDAGRGVRFTTHAAYRMRNEIDTLLRFDTRRGFTHVGERVTPCLAAPGRDLSYDEFFGASDEDDVGAAIEYEDDVRAALAYLPAAERELLEAYFMNPATATRPDFVREMARRHRCHPNMMRERLNAALGKLRIHSEARYAAEAA